MATGQGVDGYITLSDFTPGIHNSFFSTTETRAAPDGAAQVRDTWGCYAGTRGGLLPAPRLVETKTQALFDAIADQYPTGHRRHQILASALMSPVWAFQGLGLKNEYSGKPDGLFVAFSWYYDDNDDGVMRAKMKVRYYKLFRDPVTTFDLNHESGDLTIYHSDYFNYYGYASFGTTRYNNDDAYTPGKPTLIAHMTPFNAESGIAMAFPDQADPFTDTWEDTAFSADEDEGWIGNFIITHQGRVIAIDASDWSSDESLGNIYGYNFGEDGTLPSSEVFQWTPVNDPSGSRVQKGAVFVEENPTGYGVWASVNANELFLVKERGGGVVVRGDIERPTVIRLPGIPSTYGAANIPVLTDKGLVFGTRYGVWLWSGGDSAELLSPQLDGWFWRLEDNSDQYLRFGAPRGQFGYAYPFVFAPNNYILDMRTGGWFRLAKGADDSGLSYHSYHTSYSGDVYALPGYINPTQTTLFHRYDPTAGAHEYSWRSQPLARSRGRILKFREVITTLQGHGDVTITLVGLGGLERSVTFTVDSDQPISFRQSIALEAHDVEVVIASEGDESTDAAPSVLRVQLGYHETRSLTSTAPAEAA